MNNQSDYTVLDRLNLNTFPEDLLPIVYSYIPIDIRFIINKKGFNENYLKSLRHIMRSKNFDKNIKRMIRSDNLLCFSILLKENYYFWITIKNFRGKIGVNRCRTNNYISYLKELCNYYGSGKCKTKLIDTIKTKKTNKNKEFKNIKIKYTRWNN